MPQQSNLGSGFRDQQAVLTARVKPSASYARAPGVLLVKRIAPGACGARFQKRSATAQRA